MSGQVLRYVMGSIPMKPVAPVSASSMLALFFGDTRILAAE